MGKKRGRVMPRLRTLDPGASPLDFFGAEVRHARGAAGMSQAELGAAAHCDGSVVSRIEAGLAEPPAGFPEACDAAFPERGGFFTRFWRDHQGWGGPYPPWFLDWLGIEREAAVLRMWEPMLIPGLLQVEGYARAIFASWRQDSPGTVEAKVAARLDRQQIFSREDPPVLWVLVDELVLARRVGDAAVMAAQLAHLAEMAARPHVTIQVVTEQAGAYAGLSAGLVIAADPGGTQAAHLDTGIQGMTVAEPALIGRAVNLLDTLRAEALPRAASLELITEAMTRWTAQTSLAGGHQPTPAPTAVTALRSVTPAT
jgi:transcriptional regulator with XRE-family HTH domain